MSVTVTSAASLTRAARGFELTGDLTASTVLELFAQTPRFTAESPAGASPACRIDLRALGEVDSAGLALLLHWRATATAAGARLTFTAPPPQLREMAKITGTESLLGFTAGNAA